MEKLIAEAYDRLPGPEPARVTQIAERLAHRQSSGRGRAGLNRLPWWIVILALSGAAAASWYAGDLWRRSEHPVGGTAPARPEIQGDRDNGAGKSSDDGSTKRDPRGLIYKRETQ